MEALPAIAMELHNGYLTFGTPDEVKAKLLADHSIAITRAETVSFLELVGRFVGVVQDGGSGGSGGTTGGNATRYSLGAPMQDRVLSVVIKAAGTQPQEHK